MSGPAIVIALKFVSTAYALKTAADGVREGNLAKAVIGGVGAYFGATSFGTTAAGSAAGQTAGSQAAAGLGTEAGNAAATSMEQGAVSGAGAGGQAAGGAATSAPTATTGLNTSAADAAGQAASTPTATQSVATGKGFLSDAGDWINKNQTFAGGAMQLGGNLFAGYAQGEMMQKQVDEIRRQEEQRRADEEARRRRIEAQGDIGFLQQYSYNPATGMME